MPGETLEIQLGQRRNLWVQQLLSVHPRRRESRCLHVGLCGGCSLQHWDEASQLEWKASRIHQRLVQLEPAIEWMPPQGSPQSFHYRTKVEFSFLGSQLGYHRRGCFDRGVEVGHCWIAPPAHQQLLAITRLWQQEHQLAGWNPRKFEGDLRYLLLRQANPGGQWLAVLVTRSGLSRALVEDWAKRVRAGCWPGPEGLLWVEQRSTAGAIVPEFEHLLWGRDQILQPLGPLEFRLGWRSFFQSNPPAYLRLLEALRGWLAPLGVKRLLDMYCGIGSLGLSVKPPDCHLVGVESVSEAVDDARRCSHEMGLDDCEFHSGCSEGWTDWKADATILDPPRSGCHPSLWSRLESPHVFYVACNPERFLSEMESLISRYQMIRAQVFDFFPQTGHCELLVWLRRRGD